MATRKLGTCERATYVTDRDGVVEVTMALPHGRSLASGLARRSLSPLSHTL
jgi:hypothetical protein